MGASRFLVAGGTSFKSVIPQNVLRVLCILIQGSDNLRPRHRFMLRVPAIVIRNHRDARVTKLRLARQLCLGNIGHPDHFKAQLPVHVRLSQRGKLRPLDADVRPARVYFHSTLRAGIRKHSGHLRTCRLVKCNVRH